MFLWEQKTEQSMPFHSLVSELKCSGVGGSVHMTVCGHYAQNQGCGEATTWAPPPETPHIHYTLNFGLTFGHRLFRSLSVLLNCSEHCHIWGVRPSSGLHGHLHAHLPHTHRGLAQQLSLQTHGFKESELSIKRFFWSGTLGKLCLHCLPAGVRIKGSCRRPPWDIKQGTRLFRWSGRL